ncbi:exocyst complex component Sec10-domain-containing protein [Chytridium lagenaria]|nr:exocyst complex component Sec10-domain-containing protein [Chytridium lagenaria]
MKALANRTSSLSNAYSSLSSASAPSAFGMGSAKTGTTATLTAPDAAGKRGHPHLSKNLTLSSLPPDLIIRIFTFLPVPDLPKVAGCSRRLKILVYNDDVYEHKLRVMKMLTDAIDVPEGVDEAEVAAVNKLSSKLKQLPGGNLLPGGTKYLESGTMWEALSGNTPTTDGPGAVVTEPGSGSGSGSELVSTANEPSSGSNPISQEIQSDLMGLDITKAGPTIPEEPTTVTSPQRITASIPQMKKSVITIGAGGLQVAGKTSSSASVGSIGGTKRQLDPYKANVFKSLNGVRPREAFRSMYSELYPYYMDFKGKQKDSKVFRDHKDLIVVASYLRKLKLFSQSKFILDMDEVNLSLDTTIEWFESMVLGQFERAYDSKNDGEMRRNALACYHLNGGSACINLFISKNPIFYDQAFNPSLIPNLGLSLPNSDSGTSQSSGYGLADAFAKFMDHLLTSCKDQASIVGRVFEPEMDAMTSFVNKVFEDSIAEYLSAMLVTAKERETNEYISVAEPGVRVQTDKVKQSIIVLFKPNTDKYIDLELKHLTKRFDAELKKWDNRKENANKKKGDGKATYLGDAEKTQAHKRQVMSVMKTVLFAPMALGKTLAIMEGDDSDEAVTYHLDDDSMGSLVSLELCLKLMHANKEALGRTLVITSAVEPSKLRANVARLARLGKSTPVDNWSENGEKSVNMDSLQFFELVHMSDLIHQMVDVYYAEDVVTDCIFSGLGSTRNDFLSDLMVEKKGFDRSSDDNVASGMDKSIQVLINQVDHIMNQMHLSADYNPPASSKMVFDLKPTKACATVVACLQAHVKLLQGSTHKDTLEVFLGEVGCDLQKSEKWQVSPTGAMQLICDFNRYHEWASSLRVPSVSRLFLVLKELGNLYMAEGGTELRNMVHDAELYQGALRPEEIYELLAARTDYKKIQKFVETKDCLVM